MRIVVIEDERDVARLHRVILEAAGHTVIDVDQYSLPKVGEDVDVVVFDVMMPDVDGVDVAEWLSKYRPETWLVAATAVYKVPDRVIELADAIVLKPFRPDELVEAVERRVSI